MKRHSLLILLIILGIGLFLPGTAFSASANVLLIVSDDADPDPTDLQLAAYLTTNGLTVFYANDNDTDYTDDIAANSIDVVYVSATSSSSATGNEITNLSVGVVEANVGDWDEVLLSSNDDEHPGTDIEIFNNTHYITSGLTLGNLPVYSPSAQIGYGETPGSGAQILARNPSDSSESAILAYETGAQLDGGTPAPARRVGIFTEDLFANWTVAGQTLVLRAILWAAGSGASVPAATSAVAEISPNNVVTSATANAFTYDILVTMGIADSGVNRVDISVPGTYGAPTVTNVLVGGTPVAYTNNTAGNLIRVDLTAKVISSNTITVLFSSDSPGAPDAGTNFTSTVDDTDTADAAQATTEGNADGDAPDNNSWTVTTANPAYTVNYRSIGTNAAVLYSSGNASITANTSTVTFSGATLPTNIGVGDELVIGTTTFYILSRDSSSQVTVQETAVSSLTNQSYTIQRAYNALGTWEGDRDGDLVAENRREVGVAYADGAFSSFVLVDDSTTDATHYMTLTVAEGQRHDGTSGTGVIFNGGGATSCFRTNDDYTRFEWFEITGTCNQNGSPGANVMNATNVVFENLLIHDYYGFSCMGVKGDDNSSFTLRNSIIYDGNGAGIRLTETTSTALVENVTVYGITGRGIYEDSGTLTVRNSISMGNSSPDFDGGTQSYNLSDDSSAAGTGSIPDKDPALQFVNITPGDEANWDFHLIAGSDAINVGTDLSGSFTNDIDGDTRPISTQWEMGADETNAAASLNITGTVYEDVNGDADMADQAARNNVTVAYYKDGGDGQPDGVDDGTATTTASDGSGNYTFSGLSDGIYWVIVDSKTVSPNAGIKGGFAQGDVWPEQTYGTAGARCEDGAGGINVLGAAGPCYGGQSGIASDTASALATAEHVTRVVVSGGSVSGVNFGFSFNTVINTLAGDGQDDDGSNNRTVQGSLRQFIQNANAVTGANTMRFVPVRDPDASGSGQTWWQVTVTSILNAIDDADTTIDGTAYDYTDGTTIRNTNAATLGYVGAVGLGADALVSTGDEPTLAGVAGPELEIVNDRATNVVVIGLDLQADDITVDNIAIYGFGNGNLSQDADIRAGVSGGGTNFTGIVIEDSVIGTDAADFSDPGVGVRSLVNGVAVFGADGGIIRRNLIGYNGRFGIFLSDTAQTWTVQANEIRGNAIENFAQDGMDIGNGSSGATVSGNLFAMNQGSGVDSWNGLGNNLIENNTFLQNGLGATEPAGARIFGNSSIIRLNIFDNNIGAGIMLVDGDDPWADPTSIPAIQNRISRNRFTGNGENAIDLLANGADANVGDGITINDGGTDANAGNIGRDYPVITSALFNAGTTTVSGTTCANCEVEVYLAVAGSGDTDTGTDYGEGITYIDTDTADGGGNWSLATAALAIGNNVSAITIDGSGNTSEFGANVTVTADYNISGTIYDDVDGDADIVEGGTLTFANATVKLYLDDGDGLINAGDGLVTTTTTDGSGDYNFGGLADGTYYVVVDSMTLAATGYNGSFDINDVWAEQTYAVTGAASGAGFSGANGALYGGRNAGTSDDAAVLTTAEHVIQTTLSGADATGVNFGFSFNGVVNTLAGDAQDDDGGNNRTVQGSLRQFIQNANAIAGANAMRFVPAVPTNATGGGNNWWRVTVTSALPIITGDNTTLDGTAYSSVDGVTVRNDNPTVLGTGGNVGVNPLALSQVPGPELEIVGNNTLLIGLEIQGNDVTIRRFAIYGFGDGITLLTRQGNILLQQSGVLNTLIEANVLGSSAASFTDPGAGVRTGGANIWVEKPDGGTIRNNLIGFGGFLGIFLFDSAHNWTVENNEVRANGLIDLGTDGIDINADSNNAIVRGNLFEANNGSGVDMFNGGTTNLIENNTISNNGIGGQEDAGIRVYGDDHTIRRNIITTNAGSGIMITNDPGGSPPHDGNRISENAIYNNGNIGIDLHTGAENTALGTAPFITANDALDPDGGANLGQNFPIITSAIWNGANTIVQGTLNSTPGANFDIEVFSNTVCNGDTLGVAQADPYGEGETYRDTANDTTDGVTGDMTFSVSIPVNLTGQSMTATAINTVTDDTSEFSQCETVVVLGSAAGRWTFDEGSGQTAGDASGNGHDGTLGSTAGADTNDPSWICVLGGYALDFDGIDDFVLITDPGGAWDFADGGLDAGTSDFSIAAWVRYDTSAPDGFPTIIRKGGGSDTNAGYWFAYEKSVDGFRLNVSDGTNRFIANSNIGIGLADGQWHYVTAVFDREAGTDTAYFYLDANPIGSESSALIADNSVSGTDDLGIGGNPNGTLRPWKGAIDDTRIYDRVLSQAEITALAASPPTACPASASGTVFEDINYGGGDGRTFAAADASAQASGWGAGAVGAGTGVVVELYQDQSGNFIKIDDTTTDAAGDYSFTSLPDGTYRVRVVNGTVVSNRGSNATGNTPLAVQTFRNDPDSGGGVVNEVGGADPADQDDGVQANGVNIATITAQSVTEIVLAGAGVGNVDFGFNFDTIVNTNNAGQGSLRQFLLNSNELDNVNLDQQDNPSGVTAVNKIAGDEHSIFMIPAAELAATIDGGGGTVMLIQPSSALPVITDGDTAVDGSTQTAYTGDTNSAVAETTTGPEVIVDLQGIVAADVLQVNAANTIIDSMGITGADGGLADGIRNESVDGMISRNNTVFNNDKTGVRLFRVSNAQILNSVIRNNGTTDSDGITLSSDNSNSNNTISGNEIINNAGYGIDIDGATDTNNTITNNLIKGNGTGGAGQEAGIGLRDGDGNTISLNTITANTAEGIFISTGNTGNRISQNSIFNNGTLGTDMSGGSGTAGDGVSANDNLDPDGGGNNRQNFPVITSAIWNGANTVVQGTLNSLVGSTFDIEVFSSAVCNGDTGGTPTGAPNDYGEGQTYRITAGGVGTDGSGNASFNVNIPVNLTGQYITATAINTATNDTSEFSQCEAAVALVAISGTVYEDPNGDADMADQVARDTVTVALFRDGGDNQPDGVDDTFINTTTTAGGGAYSFSGLAPATYWVAVDSKTVTPSAGYNGGFGLGDVWAEQTYGIAGSWCANGSGGTAQIGAAGACFGGQDAATSDNVSAPITVADLPTAEHVTRVVVAAAVNEVNFGFSFNAVVATRDGDDDGANNRTIQGSLRQFIQHANALSGANTMRFTPAGPTNAAGGGGNWWQINPASTLDSITDADTIIDGRAYARADGVTVIDPNAGSLGTGGTVGVDPLALSQVARPELELFDTSGINMGLNINAADVTVRRLSIWAFGNSFNPASNNNANIQIGNVTGAIIEENVIGTPPNSFADPVANRTLGPNIRSINGDNGTISNNLIGFSESVGIYLSTSADNWLVENSEIRGNAIGHGSLDGIDLSVGSINATIRGNLITANSGAGVDMYQGGGQHTIENNTVTNHGSGGLEDSAIRLYGVDSTVQKNIVTANAGNGIMIVNNTGGGPVPLPYDGNLISQNRIYNNGKLGIDLHTAAENNDLGTAPYVTGNDGLDVDSGANLGQNFPVITSAVWNGANTVIEGSLNSTAGTTFNIEVFSNTVCNGDTTGTAQAQTNGEGETYRLTVNNVSTDGSGNASFSTNIPVDLTGLYMTATTINPATDDTSEFSACVQVAVPATIEFELAAASDQEANGGNLPRLIVTGTLTTDQTIEVNVTGGSAVTPGDFTNTAVVTIPAGTYSDAVAATINLSIVDDGFIEPDETINLQLANPATGLAIGDANSDSTTQNTHTYTILNDDGSATVQMASVSQNVGEGAGTATVTVQLNTAAALGTAVTVDVVDLLNGTAVVGAGNDYTYTTPTTVTFAIGATNGDTDTVTVTILDDADVEAGETINLQLQNVTGPATIPGATDDHTVTITDNEAGATVQMASVSQNVGEGAGTATVTVQLNTAAALGTAVTVDVVDLLNGTAVVGAGNDYTYTTPTTVTFAIGATNGDTDTVTVTILDDADVEAGETINLQLQNVTGPATIPGATDDHTVTITDNEAGATVQMASVSQNVGEGAGTATVTVQLNTAAALGTAVTVDVVDLLNGTAVVGAGNDYTYTTPTTVTFAIGATNGDTDTVTVTILDDADVEAGETINLQLQNVTGPATIPGATDDHTVTITDNEAGATVQMASVSQNVGEGAGTATVTVQLNTAAALGTAVTVDVVDLLNGTAVVGAGNDYTYTTPTTVTFAIGATNGDTDTVTVTILDDADVEAGETINLQLQNVTGPATIPGATDDHTVTITDNEAGATVQMASVSQNVGEGAGTATVTVQLNTAAALGTAVTVDVVDLLNGTAVVGAGNDYTYTTPTTVTFAIGATNGDTDTVTVTILDDAAVEAGETINLQLQNVTGPATIPGATDDHTVTITDNEAGATVQMAAASSAVAEDVAGGTLNVTVQLNVPGAGTLGSDVTLDVVDLLTGSATAAGTDYTFVTPTQVTFASGTADGATRTVTITIINDALTEVAEDLDLQLQNISGPATILGTNQDHTVTINDDEAGATVQMAAASSAVAEDVAGGTLDVTVQLNVPGAGTLGSDVTVDVVDLLTGSATAAGTDYTFVTPTQVTFAAGTPDGATDTVTITIINDALAEAAEDIDLQLQNISGPATIPGATDDHTVTINDDDSGATVEFELASAGDVESNGGNIPRLIANGTLVAPQTIDVTVTGGSATGGGTDYSNVVSVTIPAGNYSGTPAATINLTIIDDTSIEPNETIDFALANPSAGLGVGDANGDSTTQNTHTYTITDDDSPIVEFISASASDAESSGGNIPLLIVRGTLAAPATIDVNTTGGSATGGGVDYSSTALVTIPAGIYDGSLAMAIPINLTVVNDSLFENSETILLALANPSAGLTIADVNGDAGTQSANTYTILDDENSIVLRLTKSANKTEAAIGDIVTYKVQISNTIASDVPDARIVDYLPPNFKYVGDSARLNGAPLANPIGNRPLIFNIGTVPGLVDGNGNGFADPGEPGYLVVKYQLVVGSGAQPGDYENTAIAASGCNTCQISNSGSAEVSVTLSPLEGLTTIIGKVFLDKNRDGRQDPGETGVAGAMVALDNGTYALTDEHGRYHFPSVKAGQRLVKVNLQTLGAGAVATTKEAVVLWITPGLLAKANFGVFYETETVRIGRPGQSGIFLESQVLHKPLEVVGGAENLALLINGETASIPTDNVQLLVENLNEVVELKGNTPGSQILFKTEPGLRKDETSWRLKIMDAGGKVVRVLGGKGSLPGIVRWDGRYKKGQTVEGGEIYQYQMEVGYADGTRATSARKLFGINQNTAIFLNLTGEAFIFGSDRLSPKAKQVLKETAGVLRKYPEEKVIIEGHTDSVGTDEYNVDLSRRRAESALTYLINEEGLPPNRFVVRWYGESRPMASNEYDETRALNRRIEIKGQVDDVKRSKLYDQYRTKASVKINGKPVKVDTNGRFALEVADKSIKKLNVEVTSGRGQSYKTTIEVPSIEILNREEKVLLRYGNKSQEYQVGRPPETQGSDDKTPLVKYELRGKTEPGNTVEIDGASLPVNPDGTFAISLDLRRGNNPYGLMVRNPAGISRIVNLMATVNDRDKDGKLIVATGPAPNMHVNLPLKGVPLTSHHLTVTGATDVDNRIFINDEPVKVEINGYFSSIVNLPKGRSLLTIKAVNPEGHSSMIAREVEVTDTRLFFLALADGKVEGLMGSGFVQGAGMDDDTEYKTEGRMAFYLKGVIKGKYLITAALDTGTHEFDQLFDDLDDRENDRLLTNLDPDRIYPVYGDSSTVVYDTDSQGKLYLALDSDELHLLLGNFALNLNDTELAAYQRTLFGARIGYRSASKTQYGDSNTQVALFGAQVDQIPVTDELLATGGSLYYLSRRDIIEGSEQVTLVIRDQNTGLVLAEFLQQQNVDYNIIYSAGRILFKRPIATYSEGEEIIDQGLLPGNRVFIRVHYEAKEDMFENTAGGGRVRQQIGDHVAVGGTYIKDELDAGDYDLKSVDTEIRLGKNTRLVAEYAQSSGTGTLTFVSLDGGLTFADTAPDADREGNAWKVAAEIDIGEWFDSPGRYQIGGYYKRLDQGFFTSNTFLEEGTDKSGINLSLAIAGRDKVRARFDRVETDGTSLKSATRNDIGTFQWVHDHGWWSLTGEYQYRDAEDSTAGGTDTTHNAATRLTVKPIDPLTVEAEHQQTITGNTNNQTTVGVKYQVHPSLALEASGKSGTDGQAAWGGAVLTVGDHRLYLTERLVKDRAGQTKATVLGSESALGKSGKVYSEYQWEHTENGSLNKSVLGAQRQWDVAEGLKMNLSGQYLTTDANSDDGSQLAIAGGFSYAHPSGFRFSTREEIRRDTGDREFTQLVTSNDLEYKINSDFTSLGWFRWSKSYDDNLDETEASFTELSLGLAYRPVASDRFNALAKYTWLKQNGPQGPGEDEVLKPMTQVAAIDWSLDVTPWMEWEQKGAFRIFSEDVADMPTETTHSFLSVSRLNFNVWSDWYLGAEYRMLLQNEADDSRQGWATELMWEPLDHLRIGVGYNFTDFSDNEFSNNDYSTHGLYFRFQGNY